MALKPMSKPCEELEQGNASTTGPAGTGPVVINQSPDSYKARFLPGQEKSGGCTRGTMTGGSPVHTTEERTGIQEVQEVQERHTCRTQQPAPTGLRNSGPGNGPRTRPEPVLVRRPHHRSTGRI